MKVYDMKAKDIVLKLLQNDELSRTFQALAKLQWGAIGRIAREARLSLTTTRQRLEELEQMGLAAKISMGENGNTPLNGYYRLTEQGFHYKKIVLPLVTT